MATTAEARKTVVNMLKEGAGQIAAIKTALDAQITSLSDSSTDADIQAAIAEWDRIRVAYTDYGRIQLPTLAVLQTDILADIAAAANP